MRRLVSDVCFAAALLLGIACAAQAQFNSFPPGTFTSRAALAPAGGGGGQVVFDALGTPATASVPAGTNYGGMTVGAGLVNSALIILVAEQNSVVVSGLSIVWDMAGANQTMTLIGSQAVGNTGVWIFGLRNPAAGNKAAFMSWTGVSSNLAVVGASFQSVKQTSDAAAFAHFNSLTGSTSQPSINITSQTGNFTIANFVANDNTVNFTGVSGTLIATNNSGNFGTTSNRDAGSASVTMSATGSPAPASWAAAGFDLVAF